MILGITSQHSDEQIFGLNLEIENLEIVHIKSQEKEFPKLGDSLHQEEKEPGKFNAQNQLREGQRRNLESPTESENDNGDFYQYLKITGFVLLGAGIFIGMLILMHFLFKCISPNRNEEDYLDQIWKQYIHKYTTIVECWSAKKKYHQSSCAICLENFWEENPIRELNVWKHSFHEKCLVSYLKPK